MADPTFDRATFEARLKTRRLGRPLIARAEVESTNDVAWDALAEGAPDGVAVVADAQTRGRGREGRVWHTAPGRGLALSLGLFEGCERGQLGFVPLVAGLALVRGLGRLGLATARLKWPNDVLAGGRKLAGILCESRRMADGADAAVIGVGVNVAHAAPDFPDDLRAGATSLALAGLATSREAVAAEFLNALEPLWTTLQEGDRESLREAWKARAGGWGEPVTVRNAGATLRGVARDLGADGSLVLALDDGREVAVVAGDVALAAERE